MTWKYSVSDDGKQIKIWEPGSDTSNSPDHTKSISPDPSERKSDINEVKEVMRQEAEKAGPEGPDSGNATSSEGVSPRGWKIMTDMNAGNIEEK